jgi:hypothetical protein
MTNIVQMVFGSHLYGTNTPASDRDFKAVYIPEPRDILLGRVKDVITDNTKADTSARNTAEDMDRETFALQKYLNLAAQGQTVALDMLFADDKSIIQSSPEWRWIQINRDKLLSKQCQSYVGYCKSQANKFGIKGSRMAAAQAAVLILGQCLALDRDHTAKLGSIPLCLEAELGGMEHVEFIDIPNPAGAVVRHLSVCGKKVPFTQTIKEAHTVYKRLYDEYGKRAEAAKNNEGIDWKALSHAVRVGRQAIELLDTHVITSPRPDAEHLTKIKTGQLTFDVVAEEVETLLEEVEAAAKRSTLPDQPDRQWIDDFVYWTYRQNF